MTADIKIGGTKNKKWRNNEEKKVKAESEQPQPQPSSQQNKHTELLVQSKRRIETTIEGPFVLGYQPYFQW